MLEINEKELRENIAAYPAWKTENPKYYMAEFMKLSFPFMSEEKLAGMDHLKRRYEYLFNTLNSSASKPDVVDELMAILSAALALFNASYEDVMLSCASSMKS